MIITEKTLRKIIRESILDDALEAAEEKQAEFNRELFSNIRKQLASSGKDAAEEMASDLEQEDEGMLSKAGKPISKFLGYLGIGDEAEKIYSKKSDSEEKPTNEAILRMVIREEIEKEIIGEPDQSEEDEREANNKEKEKRLKKKKDKLRLDNEIEEDMDEMSTVGGGAIAGYVAPLGHGGGPPKNPYKKSPPKEKSTPKKKSAKKKKSSGLTPKNAM